MPNTHERYFACLPQRDAWCDLCTIMKVRRDQRQNELGYYISCFDGSAAAHHLTSISHIWHIRKNLLSVSYNLLGRFYISMPNFRLNIQIILVTLVLLLFIVFLLQNTGEMQVKFLFFDVRIPSAIVILVTTLGGFTGGYFAAFRSQRQRSKRQELKEQVKQAKSKS